MKLQVVYKNSHSVIAVITETRAQQAFCALCKKNNILSVLEYYLIIFALKVVKINVVSVRKL